MEAIWISIVIKCNWLGEQPVTSRNIQLSYKLLYLTIAWSPQMFSQIFRYSGDSFTQLTSRSSKQVLSDTAVTAEPASISSLLHLLVASVARSSPTITCENIFRNLRPHSSRNYIWQRSPWEIALCMQFQNIRYAIRSSDFGRNHTLVSNY